MADQYIFKVKSGPATPIDGETNTGEESWRFKLRPTGSVEVPAKIVVGQLEVSNLRFGAEEHQHGDEITLMAKVSGDDGMPLRFVVESNDGSGWKPYAVVPAKVTAGEAVGKVPAHHPALPATGPVGDLKNASPVQLRFFIQRGDAKPPPVAPPVPVKATSKPGPATAKKVGSLAITGAIGGEAFFVVNVKTNQPIRCSANGPIKTDATIVGKGHYFLLKSDKTARFDGLPVGSYKVIFPPDAIEGKEPSPTTVKANPQGAHVVELKDFAHQGAICEIDVVEGKPAAVQITVSAEGTVQLCC